MDIVIEAKESDMMVSVDASESQDNDSEPESVLPAATDSSDEDEAMDPVPLSDVDDPSLASSQKVHG